MPVETRESQDSLPDSTSKNTRNTDRAATSIGAKIDGATAARDIKERLAARIGPHRYEMWFGHARLEVDGPHVEVATQSTFVAKWIDANFADEIRGVARKTLGIGDDADVRVNVCVAPDRCRPAGQAARRGGPQSDGGNDGPRSTIDGYDSTHPGDGTAPRGDHARSGGTGLSGKLPATLSPPLSPPPRRRMAPHRGPSLRRLDEFVVGQSNRLAYSTACRLIDAPDATSVSPLFIHGECGLGKTHLLQGICRRFTDLNGRSGPASHAKTVRYVTGEQFTNEYIAAIRNDKVDAFRQGVRRLELLAIDDVHFLSNKVRTQGEFLHTLDAIDLTGARIVLASDEHPRLIKKFSQALISRFLSGMVVQIDRPDRSTRVSIVRRLAAARNMPMSEAAVEVVASRCVGSIRELEGAITKLAALWALARDIAAESTSGDVSESAGAGDEVGHVLVEQLFKDHGWKPPTPVRITTVIDVICERLGIGRADLMGSSRHRRVVLGRGLVATLGRELTTHSYPEIARAMGRSFHSTIHTAEHRLRRQLAENKLAQADESQPAIPLRELVDQLRHEITRVTGRTP